MTNKEVINALESIKKLFAGSSLATALDVAIATMTDHDGCDGCQYEYYSDEDEPCCICKGNYLDRFKPRGNLSKDEVAVIRELIARFEDEEAVAHAKSSGLKEPAVWNKAIRLLEEYIS